MPRYFLELAYRGTRFVGWQNQPNGQSVQAVVEHALTTALRQPIAITGSGRTDAGVHAEQQFAHFDLPEPLENTSSLLQSVNALLGPDVAAFRIFGVQTDDHARFSATSRYYQYRIIRQKDPFRAGLAYLFNPALDVAVINEAAKILLQHIDFESFSKIKTDVKTFNCSIDLARWEQNMQGDLTFHIRADRFLRGMVRAIVGTLLNVGQGRLTTAEFEQIILSRNRKHAGRAVPPEGLFLVKVAYPESVFSLATSSANNRKRETENVDLLKPL
jgi:tRNA pseudouridine38-40 synthase